MRRLYEAFETRENAWPFEVYDPEIEWHVWDWFAGLGFEPVYRGHDGVRAYWRHWLEAWRSIEFRVENAIDTGDEVVAMIWQRSLGRASGAEVEFEFAQVWTLHTGRVTRMCSFEHQQGFSRC